MLHVLETFQAATCALNKPVPCIHGKKKKRKEKKKNTPSRFFKEEQRQCIVCVHVCVYVSGGVISLTDPVFKGYPENRVP